MHKTEHVDGALKKYLSELASRKMTPGGGSASAVAACLGAGLNLMVINYTIPKEGGTKPEIFELARLREEQEKRLSRLMGFVDEDCAVFSGLMRALADKVDTESAYKNAAAVPNGICAECAGSMNIAAFLAENAKESLITDVACAARIIEAAFHSAEYNVRVNLAHIKDTAFVSKMNDELKEGGRLVTGFSERVARIVGEKLARGLNG
jgi:formiminotetrahydrofolate cyclodeaminase